MSGAYFKIRTLAKRLSPEKCFRRYLAFQRAGLYSELRIIQHGRADRYSIVGYKWPAKSDRRAQGVGKANPGGYDIGTAVIVKVPSSRYPDLRRGVTGLVADPKGIKVSKEIAAEMERAGMVPVLHYMQGLTGLAVRYYMPQYVKVAPWWRKNPSVKHGPTANQVAFGQAGRVKVGWIHRETPTRYEVAYKEGPRLKTVWRRKDKVTFVRSGRRGQLAAANPCLKEANPASVRQAAGLSARFHGHPPRWLKSINVPAWPRALAQIGQIVRLDYVSDKHDGKLRRYYHDFKQPIPLLAAPISRKQNMLLIIGRFRLERAGITG